MKSVNIAFRGGGNICDSIEKCQLNGIYKDIAENISIEVALLIYQHYKGLQVTFPKKLYDPEFVKAQVMECGKDADFKELARKFEYSERWLRKMLKDSK